MKNWLFVRVIIYIISLLSALYLSVELINDPNDFSVSIGLIVIILFGILTYNFVKYISKEYRNS